MPTNVLAVSATEKYPIEQIDSDYLLGYGQNIDGRIYVPLRLLFEATSAEVDYQPTTKVITIRRADGAVITMGVDSQRAEINLLGQCETLNMPGPAHLLEGTTYVPLRFAADNLMCAVEWDNVAKKVLLEKQFVSVKYGDNRYVLDFGSGKLYKRTVSGESLLLGQPVGVADFRSKYFDKGWRRFVNIWDVQENSNGIISLDWNFNALDSPRFLLWRMLLTPDGQNNRSFIFIDDNRFKAIVPGESIWWPEENRVFQLDSTNGAILAEYSYQKLLTAMPQAHSFGFMFCDGQYMLLSYQQEANWFSNLPVLVNLQTGDIIDLFAELIPENERKDFHFDNAAPSSSLQFLKAKDGVLYFNYWTLHRDEVTGQQEELEITYKYK